MMFMRIIDKLKERGSFTPAENQIAEFIRENSRDVVSMPLDQMAEKLYVSKSTIIRFCKKLGFHGHKELCVQLAKELNAFMAADTELNASMPLEHFDDRRVIVDKLAALYYRAVSETYQEVNLDVLYRLARQIRDRKSAAVYAADEDYAYAMSFAVKLSSLGIQTDISALPEYTVKQSLYQTAETPSLMISYRGNEQVLLQAAKILNERKIPFTLISGPFPGGLKRYAAETAEISFYEPEPRIAALGSVTAMTFILDILFAYVFSMDFEKNTANIKTAAEMKKKLSESGRQ